MPLWTISWILVLFNYGEAPTRTRLAAMVALAAIGFGLKFTTPPLVMGTAVVALGVQSRTRYIARDTLGAVLAGLLIFSAGYLLWTAGSPMSLSNLVAYAWNRAVSPAISVHSMLGKSGQAAAELSLWASPFLLALGVLGTLCAFRQGTWQQRVLGAVGVVLVGGYLMIGATTFGYPKYHAPAVPILCALVAHIYPPGMEKRALRAGGLAVLLVVAWNMLVVGDILFMLRVTLREAMAWGHPELAGILWDVTCRTLAPLLPIVVIPPFLSTGLDDWRTRVRFALIAAAVGGCVATTISHTLDGSRGKHPSGGPGTERVVEVLREKIGSGRQVIATQEILYQLGILDAPDGRPVSFAAWNESSRFLQAITLRWPHSVGQEIGRAK